MSAVEEFKRHMLKELQELQDRFPEEWVAVQFDCTALEEEEQPIFLWRGGWHRCIVLRLDDLRRKAVIITPEGMFTTRLSLTIGGGSGGKRPCLCPNWREKEEADNLTWAACGPQAQTVLDLLRLENQLEE